MTMSQVYLIHFDKPYKHARHYIGWSEQLDRRTWHHANGTGARLMQVVTQAGINWQVVRVWDDADKNFERRLKRNKHSARLCPVCNPEHWSTNIQEDNKL